MKCNRVDGLARIGGAALPRVPGTSLALVADSPLPASEDAVRSPPDIGRPVRPVG